MIDAVLNERLRDDEMVVREGSLDEAGSDEATDTEALRGLVEGALIGAAIFGAIALLSGWLAGIGFDGADLMVLLGGGR
ncbi:MAG TPA: hypothetical protein VFK86_06910 [Bauldia sp.]|nr:hypothetical protein [Bauldia sp.]